LCIALSTSFEALFEVLRAMVYLFQIPKVSSNAKHCDKVPVWAQPHAYAVALHMMYYNFVRMHSKLRLSPAMAACQSGSGEIADIVALVEVEEAKIDRKRGPYNRKS
jgi:cyanate permease